MVVWVCAEQTLPRAGHVDRLKQLEQLQAVRFRVLLFQRGFLLSLQNWYKMTTVPVLGFLGYFRIV